jgi:hypothetical protein
MRGEGSITHGENLATNTSSRRPALMGAHYAASERCCSLLVICAVHCTSTSYIFFTSIYALHIIVT